MNEDENKKSINFKTTKQEIKFRGSNNYKPKIRTDIEEISISNELEVEKQEKLSFENLSDGKVSLSENTDDKISLFVNDDKIAIPEGNDIQLLSNDEINFKLVKNEEKENTTLDLPFRKRRKYKPKEDIKTEELYIRKNNITTNSNINKDVLGIEQSKDVDLEINSEITRQNFSSFKNNNNSWGSKKPAKAKTTKPDYIIEEESNGITRSSSFKKPKKAKKEVYDEEGYIRQSQQKKTTFKAKAKKEIVYNEEQLYNYGINRLSEQNYGRHELFKKMNNLQSDETMINRVLDKLENQKYLSDENRIRSFLMSYSSSESINKTKQRLIQKGFNKKDIEAVIEVMEESGIYKIIQDTETEEEKAIAILVRKYRIYEESKKEKMTRYLISKGFPYDVTSQAMKTFSNGEYDSYDPYS